MAKNPLGRGISAARASVPTPAAPAAGVANPRARRAPPAASEAPAAMACWRAGRKPPWGNPGAVPSVPGPPHFDAGPAEPPEQLLGAVGGEGAPDGSADEEQTEVFSHTDHLPRFPD